MTVFDCKSSKRLSNDWRAALRSARQGEMQQSHTAALRSISILWVGTMAGAGLAFATQVLLARVLGVEEFGVFSAALAMVTLVAPLAGFGVSAYWLNAFGREGWTALRWLPGSFVFLMISALGVLALLLTWAWAGPHDRTTAILLSTLAIQMLGLAAIELTSAKFQLEGQHGRLASWQFTPHLLRFLVVLGSVIFIGKEAFGAMHAAMAHAIVACIILLLGAHQLGRMARGWLALEGHGARPEASPVDCTHLPGAAAIASAAWPFGLTGVFYLIYFQSDIILVKYLVGESAAGIYNVAFVVMVSVYLFPSVVFQKFLLPRLHRWAHHDTEKLRNTYRTGNRLMLVLGLTAMALLWLLAPPLLPWLFGDEYRDAVALLMILAIAVPFRFLASSAGAVLTTRDHMRLKMRLMSVTALSNVVLNLILIPEYGAAGAAWATVFTEFLLLALLQIHARKVLIPEQSGAA